MTEPPIWGRVVARPHEYVIVMRGGRVRRSGQGLAVFKWPWDSVAIVPTSIQKLSFRADQVTLEKTGVEVTGLAVYRVCDPLLAFRMVDAGEVATLTDVLRDMFVGATRRIVAGLRLEECITHRKERVAAALMTEIAPVLAGEGAIDDTTTRGWGVVLDTIEIQDVRVLSEEVFARLQAPYREALALEALVARDKVAREEARLAYERARAAEHARRDLMEEEERRLLAERERAVEDRAHRETLQRRDLEADLARKQRAAEAERERAAVEVATRRQAAELEAEIECARRVVPDLSEARLRELLLTETAPRVADSLRGSFDTIRVTTSDAAAFGAIGAVLGEVRRAVTGAGGGGERGLASSGRASSGRTSSVGDGGPEGGANA